MLRILQYKSPAMTVPDLSRYKRYFLPVIIVLATILLTWTIGMHDVDEWDEARNGTNACEMYHNGDYVNYYYGGQPDTWNAKPPLIQSRPTSCFACKRSPDR